MTFEELLELDNKKRSERETELNSIMDDFEKEIKAANDRKDARLTAMHDAAAKSVSEYADLIAEYSEDKSTKKEKEKKDK